jgi:Pvc16 N-terminal domain
MIDAAMKYVVQDLNGYFYRKVVPKPERDTAVLSILANPQGEIAVTDESTLVVSVVSILEEKSAGTGHNRLRSPSSSGGSAEKIATIDLNVFVLISAYFPAKLTDIALRYLSGVVLFFMEKPVFHHSNSPGLDQSVERIGFEIYNLDFMQQSNLWSSIGAKLMPSVLYKARVQLTPDAQTLIDIPRISQAQSGIAR